MNVYPECILCLTSAIFILIFIFGLFIYSIIKIMMVIAITIAIWTKKNL